MSGVTRAPFSRNHSSKEAALSSHVHRRLSKIIVASLAGVSLLTIAASPAGATYPPFPGGRVLPGQEFGAVVNGHSDQATIAMACFGPLRPGQRSHPMGGQTLGIFRPEVLRVQGYTGTKGRRIVAHFSDDPSKIVTFTRYESKPLPTSLNLPCSGSGTVVFSPEPTSPTASPAVVHVSYEGQP